MAEQADLRPEGRISRRDALRVGAAAGGVLWATPVVQALNVSPAAAQTGSQITTTSTCTGTAFAVHAVLSTTVPNGLPKVVEIGPVHDNSGAEDCDGVVSIPELTLTSLTECVKGGCAASYKTEQLDFVIPVSGGIPVTGTGLFAKADATCAGGSHDWTIGYLKIGTTEIVNHSKAGGDPDPPSQSLPAIPGLTGTVDIIHTGTFPGNANSQFIDLLFIEFKYVVPNGLPGAGTITTGTIRVGHAEAAMAGCP